MPSGRIQHFCILGAEDAPAGFASVITGDYDIDLKLLEEDSVGDGVLTVLGLPIATINFTATAPLKSEIVKFDAPANGSAMTALANYLLITDTGRQYKLEVGCGSDLKVSIASGENGRVQISGTMQFGKVTELSGAVTPAYLTSIGHQKAHAQVAVDTTAVIYDSIEIGAGTTVEPTMAAAGPRTAYAGWDCVDSVPTLSLATAAAIETVADQLAGDDAGSPVPHDVVLTLANGVSGENLSFTLADYAIKGEKGAMDAAGKRWHMQEFTRGTGTRSGRLTIA